MIKIELPFIVLETRNKSLIFEVKKYIDAQSGFDGSKLIITQKYFGNKENVPELVATDFVGNKNGSDCDYIIQPLISSTYGNGSNTETLLLLDNPDGTYVNRFFFKEAKSFNGGKNIFGPKARSVSETLELIEIDEEAKLELHHYYSLCDDSDIIISKKELVNHNEKSVVINRFMSLELPINSKKLKVSTYDGDWLFERNKHDVVVESGVFFIDSKTGTSSHKHNPFVHVEDSEGNIYASNLIYAGNHKEIVEVDHLYRSAFFTGINDFTFGYELKPNESFITPEAVFLMANSLEEMTSEYHRFIMNHIISPNFAFKPRPIIFNNWEGTGVRINEQSLLDMADIAVRCGVEQFVMDDGWFKGRVTDNRALGDWTVDYDKFPSGLKSFVDKVKAKGLKFGIWVEPEMICFNSDLYREHPEFAMVIPSRAPIQRRTQLMLDMANPAVVDNIFNQLDAMITDINPDYIKWDYNRFITDPYSSTGIKKGEYSYRFIQGLYTLLEKLANKYPDLIIEGCSSGGGRFDLGILYYHPQIWASDDTSTHHRSYINTGTLMCYPQSTLGAHVSRDHGPGPSWNYYTSSLEDRFNLNCFGAFGYEFDFRTINEHDQETISKQTAFYKEYRELLQLGHLVINNSPFDGDYLSYGVHNADKSESIVLIEKLSKEDKDISWCIKGLDDNLSYQIKARPQDNFDESLCDLGIHTGLELRTKGIECPQLFKSSNDELYPHGMISRLLVIKKI